jgi:hypothetical protein
VPLSVAAISAPGRPTAGLILISVGRPCALIVNARAALVPEPVVTVTDRSPTAASAAIVNSAERAVALVTVTLLTATPAPLTATDVAPATKFDPVIACATVDPAAPLAALTAASPGIVVDGVEVSLAQPIASPRPPAMMDEAISRRRCVNCDLGSRRTDFSGRGAG